MAIDNNAGPASAPMTMIQALRSAMDVMLERDGNVVLARTAPSDPELDPHPVSSPIVVTAAPPRNARLPSAGTRRSPVVSPEDMSGF